MKIGMRKPSLKKSITAKTTGAMKRACKSALPGYGKKGAGIAHPVKAAKSSAYKKTTFGLKDLFR